MLVNPWAWLVKYHPEGPWRDQRFGSAYYGHTVDKRGYFGLIWGQRHTPFRILVALYQYEDRYHFFCSFALYRGMLEFSWDFYKKRRCV